MKINIFKKIITLTYLAIFSFGLFIPFNQSFAQTSSAGTLTLSANSVISGQSTVIITTLTGVTDPDLKAGGQIVLFYSTSPSDNYAFSNSSTSKKPTCTLPALQQGQNTQSCSITFTASVAGTFHINAIIFANQADYNTYLLANYQSGALPTNQIANINIINVDIVVKTTATTATTDTTYTPLAPLPGLGNAICKDSTGNNVACIETNPKIQPCPFGNYLNIMIKIVIGFSAVLAMVMIVMGGIEYMTAELVSGKEEGKERITHAVLGLILALGAFLILNTINPQLLSACLDKLPQADITITNFNASGGLTFNGQPITVNFNTQAYPAAKTAFQKTGVDTAFILAIFAQETSSGGNTGSCNYATANMGSGQLDALKTIATSLNKDYTTINMSCAGAGSSNGGAIGLTQFIPTTWLQYKDTATGLLGHQPDPWNVADALMMTSVKLKNDGGVNDQIGAACKYFGNCNTANISCGGGTTGTYGQCVMGKKVSIQQQITDAISKGTLTP